MWYFSNIDVIVFTILNKTDSFFVLREGHRECYQKINNLILVNCETNIFTLNTAHFCVVNIQMRKNGVHLCKKETSGE